MDAWTLLGLESAGASISSGVDWSEVANFLDRFLPDPEFEDDRWFFETPKTILTDAYVAFSPFDPDFHKSKLGQRKPYSLDPSCPTALQASDKVSVFIFERDEAASVLQEAGWEFVLNNVAAIEESLTQKLLCIHKRGLTQLLEEELPGNPAFEKHWKVIQETIPDAETAVNRFYKLVGISLATTGLDECCFVGFEFQTGWDLDHGLEIVMHKDRVLAAAGLTELVSAYGSIVDGIKAIQQYEKDPGDLELT